MLRKLIGGLRRCGDYTITIWWRDGQWNVAVTLDGERIFERGDGDPRFTRAVAEATGLIVARRHERTGRLDWSAAEKEK